MRRRSGWTLLELLVVVTILLILIGIGVPAILRAAAVARGATCASNLHNIGIAVTGYHFYFGQLPPYRICPAPWQGGQDLYGEALTSPTTYTGPGEMWWAPYDNRPGSTPTRVLDDNYQRGLLWDFLEQNRGVFQCPEGIDSTPGSPTNGERYQVSYGMNYVTGGPSNRPLSDIVSGRGAANVMYVWDHSRTPGCADSRRAAPRGPWRPYSGPGSETHYPLRHGGGFHVLFCDGHVRKMAPTELMDQFFYAR